jgi:hypothetical protein
MAVVRIFVGQQHHDEAKLYTQTSLPIWVCRKKAHYEYLGHYNYVCDLWVDKTPEEVNKVDGDRFVSGYGTTIVNAKEKKRLMDVPRWWCVWMKFHHFDEGLVAQVASGKPIVD